MTGDGHDGEMIVSGKPQFVDLVKHRSCNVPIILIHESINEIKDLQWFPIIA